MNPADATLEDKLREVVTRAARKLPGDVGQQLLQLIEPRSLAIMAGVVTAWAVAQFFGVGEVADVVLIIAGWAAFGGVALSAGTHLFHFGVETHKARTDADLDRAANDLAQAVALLTVQTVLAVLLHKPSGVLKEQYLATPETPNPYQPSDFDNLPSNRWWGHQPSVKGTRSLGEGAGATDPVTGDVEYSIRGSQQEQDLARAHESVHKFLTPKLNLLRGLRGFVRAQGYNRSYILRYLEEALAETYAQLKVKGISGANLKIGARFPAKWGYVTVSAIRAEAKGLMLGPITVGGMVGQASHTVWVWYSPGGAAFGARPQGQARR